RGDRFVVAAAIQKEGREASPRLGRLEARGALGPLAQQRLRVGFLLLSSEPQRERRADLVGARRALEGLREDLVGALDAVDRIEESDRRRDGHGLLRKILEAPLEALLGELLLSLLLGERRARDAQPGVAVQPQTVVAVERFELIDRLGGVVDAIQREQ